MHSLSARNWLFALALTAVNAGGDETKWYDYPAIQPNGEFVIDSSPPLKGKLDRGARFWDDPAAFRPYEKDGVLIIHYIRSRNGAGCFFKGIKKEQIVKAVFWNHNLEEKPVVKEFAEGVKLLPPGDPPAKGEFYLEIKLTRNDASN